MADRQPSPRVVYETRLFWNTVSGSFSQFLKGNRLWETTWLSSDLGRVTMARKKRYVPRAGLDQKAQQTQTAEHLEGAEVSVLDRVECLELFHSGHEFQTDILHRAR